jgi:tetratricopeptide (TPR) repeat protein
MRKIIVFIFIVLVFLLSCSEKSEKASDYINKEKALWDGNKYTDSKKAIEYLNNAIKLEKSNGEYYNKRGTAYYNLSQYQRAIEDYSEAVRLSPNYFLAYYNRGNAYANIRQFEKAIEDYNQVIRLQPNDASVYYNRGIVYFNQGNKKLGCSDAQKLCQLGNCKFLELTKQQRFCR